MKVLLFIGLFTLSLGFCLFIEEKVINMLLEKLIFNAIAVLVGLSIAVIGIFLGSVNTIYLSLHKIVKSNDKTLFSQEEIVIIKDRLSCLITEMKENALFCLYAFFGTMILVFIKEADIPYIRWFIEGNLITKAFVYNLLIVFTTLLIFYSIIDSIKAAFQITSALELVQEDEN